MRNLSMVGKIGGGFGLVLTLLLVVSLVSWNGITDATGGLRKFQEFVGVTGISSQLQADMLLAQMNVKDFIISGNQEAIKKSGAYLLKVENSINRFQTSSGNLAHTDKISEIAEEVLEYKSAIAKIVSLKKERNQLFNGKLGPMGTQIAKDLGSIMDAAHNDQDEVATYLAGMALRNLLFGRIYVFDYVESSSQEDADKAVAEFAQFDGFVRKMTILLQDDSGKEMARKNKAAGLEYVDIFMELTALLQERNLIVANTLDTLGPAIVANVGEITLSIAEEQKTLGPRLQAEGEKSIYMVVAIAALALTFGGLCALVLTRSITQPILQTVEFAETMAKGDFTRIIAINQKDEIGSMADALNTMTRQLAAMLNEVIEGVDTLSTSATGLKGVAQQLSTGSVDTSQKSHSVASATEEMSINMSAVAASLEESSANTNLIALAAEDMTETVGQISQGTEKARGISDNAVAQSQEVSQKMKELGQAALQIGKVTEAITEISEQTNLLALNATIEAARAGEAGKGFAVVANEIKELAKQTANATVDIKNQIDSMQNTTSTTVEDIRQISDTILEIHGVINAIGTAVEEQGEATSEIAKNISQSSRGITEISETVSQASLVVTDISEEISEVNMAAEEIAKNSTNVESSADKLTLLATQLTKMVGKFKV